MSKADYSVHPGNPAAQPFNVGARPNKTKKHSWWNASSTSFWRNRQKKEQSNREGSDKDSSNNNKPRKFKKNSENM